MLKVFTKKRFWKKLCTVLLCLVLCFTLVVNSVVDVFANPVAVGLFELILAILAACGITFGTVALAHDGVDAFTSGASSGVTDLLNSKLAEIATLAATAGVVYTIGINFLSEQWQMITADVVRIFGDYTGVDVRLPIEGDFTLSVGKKISTQLSYSSTSHNQYVADTFYYDVYGRDFDFSKSPSFISNIHNSSPYNLIIALTIAGSITLVNNTYGIQSNTQGSIDSFIAYNNTGFLNYNMSSIGTSSCPLYINGEPCTFVKTSTGYTLQNSAGSNVISGCILVGTDVPINDSICPDDVFVNEKSVNDWIAGLINGDIPVGALPGNPGIDTTAYPGNDVWHDGSINDDVATGNPSIGISVPTDVSDDDIATLNPSKARDYSNADVKDKDVTTGDNDKPGDKDKDKTGTSPKVPAVSLPEILFKEKFPFCLPWDLYNLFAGLNTSAEAPKFVIPFKIERFGIDESITIDLSEFTEQVKIVRFFIGAGFVLALILISRKMIGAE